MRTHPIHPGQQLVLTSRIGQRQHRLEVMGWLKPLKRPGANTLCRRVASQQRWILAFKLAQLVDQFVISGVRYLGSVGSVVELVVAIELSAKLINAATGRRWNGRAHSTSPAAGTSRLARS